MLRRGQCTSKATFGAISSLSARRYVSAEEQAEIDREAKLRQDFMKKKMEQAQSGSFFQRVQAQAELAQAQMQAMQQQKQQGGGNAGANAGGAGGNAGANPWGPGSGPGNMRSVSIGSMLWSSLLYSMAIYLVIAVYYMRKPQSSVLSFNGAPQWAVPVETTVAYLAVRVLLTSDKQQELQSGYDAFVKTNPNLSFYQWLSTYQPNALAGTTTTQAEFLNALVAVARGTGNTSWTTAISRVSRWGDNGARVDSAMANLRRDHAQHLNAPIPAGSGHTPGYGNTMPSGQQAYGYGGGDCWPPLRRRWQPPLWRRGW